MTSLLDPAGLFNSAVLQLHVPPRPHSTSPPPSTAVSLDASPAEGAAASGSADIETTDAWVKQLVQESEREVGYYDEHLPFYLLLRLPTSASTPPLNRAQAAALLLPPPSSSTPELQPHLQLTADVSYVEGSPLPHPPPLPHHQQSNSASALGNGHPSSFTLRKGSLPSLPPPSPDPSRPPPPSASNQPRMPLTPSPLPATREQDGFIAADKGGVSVWTGIFTAVDGGNEDIDGEKKRRGQWLGRVGDEWVAVWEFCGVVAFVQTALRSPRLCLTVTATFRDDPQVAHLLLQASEGAENGNGGQGENDEDSEDEWLVESFDDVNLLSALSSLHSAPLHLPASRLPQPLTFSSASSAPSTSRPRRSSRTSFSGALPPLPTGAEGQHQLQSCIRRSVRRVLGIKAAVGVRMRSVPCSSVAVAHSQDADASLSMSMGAEGRGETDGLIMCVEVEGVGGPDGSDRSTADDDEGFEVLSVEIEVTPSPSHSTTASTWMGTSDIQVRSLASSSSSSDPFPILLGPREQHNFLYSVTFSSEAAAARLAGLGAASEDLGAGWKGESVPREVATSPSQRFTARFGDAPMEAPRQERRSAEGRGGVDQWLRGVAIVVRGRPIKMKGSGDRRSLAGGYAVEDAAATASRNDEQDSPTLPFSSRWNCTLDISPFAQRSPPRIAAFDRPIPLRPSSLPPSIARFSQPTPTLPSSATKRNSRPDLPQIEAVAGSKRHTMASLASMAAKSPVLQQRAFNRSDVPLQDGRLSLSLDTRPRTSAEFRALPQPPSIEAQTPGATGPPRRFFSLPPGAVTPSDLQQYASSPNRPISPLPPPTTPAYPPHHSAKSAVPHVDPLGRRDDGANMGLGLDGAGAMHGQDRVGEQRTGNTIVSVSLIPLRLVKSQRPPALAATADETDSSPEIERKPRSGPLSPHATFQFPSPTSSPDPSARASPEPVASAAAPLPFPSMERRPSSSIYPAPSAAPFVKEPRPRAPRIGLLDVFLVEVFIVNRGDDIKRFTVGVPVRKAEEKGVSVGGVGSAAGATRKKENEEERVAKIVALENDVRIGPLAPNTCASVRLRFLAIRPGAHTLEELRLVDLGTGLETRLRNSLCVVVE